MKTLEKIDKKLRTIGTSLQEMSIIFFVIVGLVTALHLLWGGHTTSYLWLMMLTIWAILHIKKSRTTWQRFRDIDARDMEYKEYLDQRIEHLEETLKKMDDSKL